VIRDWCDACGRQKTTQPWRGGGTITRCPERCGFDDGPTIGDVAGAFWQAVAFERATLAAEFGRDLGPDRKPEAMANVDSSKTGETK
jgi:hypothetical protein